MQTNAVMTCKAPRIAKRLNGKAAPKPKRLSKKRTADEKRNAPENAVYVHEAKLCHAFINAQYPTIVAGKALDDYRPGLEQLPGEWWKGEQWKALQLMAGVAIYAVDTGVLLADAKLNLKPSDWRSLLRSLGFREKQAKLFMWLATEVARDHKEIVRDYQPSVEWALNQFGGAD